MEINSFIGGYDKNLSYLIWCTSSKRAALIDPSTEINEITEYIETHDLILEKVLITHTHFDHIKYLDDLTDQFPFLQICGYKNPEEKFADNYRGLDHHEIISLGTEMITVIHTPGHYPDSVCYWNKKGSFVFTGDTMFVGRTGRTIGAKSNNSNLYTSIYDKLLKLPQQTIIYPGHHYGYKKSITLKENISLSPFFQCNSEHEFIRVMENYEKTRRH